jgi:hypothetical protein
VAKKGLKIGRPLSRSWGPSPPDRSDRYWDGAITGCNSPVLATVTEAKGTGQNPDNVVALSL